MCRSALTSLLLATPLLCAALGCREEWSAPEKERLALEKERPAVEKERLSPQAILEKAVRAHGGEANFTKRRLGKSKGFEKGDQIDVRWEETFDYPDKWIRRRSGSWDGQEFSQVFLCKDGRLWVQQGQQPVKERDGPPAALASQTWAFLSSLVLLLRSKPRLSPLDDADVEGAAAAGVRVEADGLSVDYYFNKKSGLVVKTVVRPPGRAYVSETNCGDFRTVDGAILPHRLKTTSTIDSYSSGGLRN
jgi:hypothetical protein